MKIRTLFGLGVIGSAVYAHKRHGGDFTVESMKKSLHDLWSGIQGTANDVKAKAAELTSHAQGEVKSATESTRTGATSAASNARNALGPR